VSLADKKEVMEKKKEEAGGKVAVKGQVGYLYLNSSHLILGSCQLSIHSK
jgi:hypothetical protein